MDSWLYSPPNSDGTCRHPDQQMFITRSAPGTCFTKSSITGNACNPEKPYKAASVQGYTIPTNKYYGYCAPSCKSGADCPEVGVDPTSGKRLQGIPMCTAYDGFPWNISPSPWPNVGHCVITDPYTVKSQEYEECKRAAPKGGTDRDLCNAAAEFLHNSPADNYLHIDNDESCQRYYSDFLQNNDYGKEISYLLESTTTPSYEWLLNPKNWCSSEPVFPMNSITDATYAGGRGSRGECNVKQGTLRSKCEGIDCASNNYKYDEFSCRRESDCCQWYLRGDPFYKYFTSYYPLPKTPAPTPP